MYHVPVASGSCGNLFHSQLAEVSDSIHPMQAPHPILRRDFDSDEERRGSYSQPHEMHRALFMPLAVLGRCPIPNPNLTAYKSAAICSLNLSGRPSDYWQQNIFCLHCRRAFSALSSSAPEAFRITSVSCGDFCWDTELPSLQLEGSLWDLSYSYTVAAAF